MLATFRVPLLDARGFVADPSVAQSVTLPGGWVDGDVVRGMGRVSRRPGGAIEPWSREAAFADLRRTLSLDPNEVQRFNRENTAVRIGTIRKRGWLALASSPALFDVDVGVQLLPDGTRGARYPRAHSVNVEELASAVAGAAALPVHVKDSDPHGVPLLNLGPPLASRYARHTSDQRDGDRLVRPGRTMVVVEAPGLLMEGVAPLKTERLKGTHIHLSSFDRAVPGGGRIRVHLLWGDHGSKGDRKRIRELRIHILRLQSVYEMMRSIASLPRGDSPLRLAEKRSEAGFDSLQAALLDCVRIVRHEPDVDLGRSVLGTAFLSRNFVDRDLDGMLDRVLGGMRPRVQREVRRFVDEERARGIAEQVALSLRDGGRSAPIVLSSKNLTVMGDLDMSENKYQFNGPVTGPVGDGARIEGNVVAGRAKVFGNVIAGSGHVIKIGDESFSGELLAGELRALRDYFSAQDHETAEASVAIFADAEVKAKEGDSGGLIAALKRTGSWAVGIASQIGAQVASAAIKASLGM